MRSCILLVEDNPTLRTVLARTLRAAGYEVLVAADAEAGISLLHGAIIDLVLTDIELSTQDGFAVLAASVLLDAHRPVILMTGAGSATGLQRGLREHARAYMLKPFQLDELLARIHQFLPRQGTF